jgi:magnesium-transporting ATPase (P-type)
MATKSNMASNLKGSNLSHFEEKKSYEFFINDPQKNDVYDHENNTISTTKYNIITFLPKALLYQFMRYANIYFLVIAIVQLIKTISPLNPMTAVAPIIFVLFVSLVREAIEDYNRYLFDNENNNEVVHVYREDNWVEDFSGTLVLGEFVMVKQDQAFPADLILVDSNLPDGLCYIETATLDGEKTLKMKIANKITAGFFKNGESCKNYFSIGGFTICDLPNSNLYKFDGTIDLNMQAQAGSTLTNQNQNTVKISLSEKQLLLKGIISIIQVLFLKTLNG